MKDRGLPIHNLLIALELGKARVIRRLMIMTAQVLMILRIPIGMPEIFKVIFPMS